MNQPLSAASRRTGIAVLATIVLLEIVHGIEEIALLPHYFVESLGLGATSVGLVISSYLVADLVCRVPAGWLTDRYGRRNVLLAGIVLTALVIPPMAFVSDAPTLFALNALNGVGAGAMWPAVYALVADSYESKKRGVAMSVVNMVMLGGLASGPIIGNIVIGLLSYGPAFWLCFALALIALVIAVILLEEPKERAIDVETPDIAGRGGAGLVLLGLGSVAVAFALALLLPVINLFGRDVLGLTPTGLAGVLAAPALITAAALVPSGLLADRIGRRPPLLGGLVVMALPFLLAPISTQPVLVALGGIVAGIGYALVAPSINALLLDYLPAGSRGLTAGIVVALQGIGIAFGPAFGGWLYESYGPYAPLTATAVILLGSAAVLWPVGQGERRKAKGEGRRATLNPERSAAE